jgi:Flp pilus assembly protein TadG
MSRPPGARALQHAPTERGSATVELVLVTPLLLALTLFAVLAGRLTEARAEVDGAARDAARAASIARDPAAARAASIARDPAAARAAAHASATATLAERHLTCRALQVRTDTSAFRAGGHVAVQLACTVDLGDLSLLRVPGTRTIQTRFVAPLDTFRETHP